MKKIVLLLLPVIMLSFVSAASTNIVSDTSNEYYDGSNWQNAVATWVHGSWPSISGATWIWNSLHVTDPTHPETVQFKKTFALPACETGYTGSIKITTDNEYILKINGHSVGSDTNWQTVETYSNIGSDLVSGSNLIEIEAKNRDCTEVSGVCDWSTNPAGVLYSADISCGNEVPEFTVIGSALALVGAVSIFLMRRK